VAVTTDGSTFQTTISSASTSPESSPTGEGSTGFTEDQNIALGVGIGIGVPTLIVGALALMCGRRRGMI